MLDERQEQLYDRLAALAPSCGSCLEPLMRGFDDPMFRAQLQDFVAARAPAFLVLCEDGSHPLAWTAYHNEYKQVFDFKLQEILGSVGMTQQDLVDLCMVLRTEQRNGFLEDGGLNSFLEAVTACEEYDKFLTAMFAEVGRQAGEQVDVAVPMGLGPGCTFQVSYLGITYEVVVPENCCPGDTFRIAVARPPNVSESMFSLPDSFFGLD